MSFSLSAVLLKLYKVLSIHGSSSAQRVLIFNLMFNQNGSDQNNISDKLFRPHLRTLTKRGVKQRQKGIVFEGISEVGQKIISRAEATSTPTSSLFLMLISICITKESYKRVQRPTSDAVEPLPAYSPKQKLKLSVKKVFNF